MTEFMNSLGTCQGGTIIASPNGFCPPYGGHRFKKFESHPSSGLACSLVNFFCNSWHIGTWHVSCATNRSAIGTIVFPLFRCLEKCLTGPDRPSRLCSRCQNAGTDRQTDRQTPLAQLFSVTHQKSSSITPLMLKH